MDKRAAEVPERDNPYTIPYTIKNPEEFARNLLRFYEEGGRIATAFLERSDMTATPFSAASEFSEAAQTVNEITQIWMAEPTKLAEAQSALMKSYAELWSNTLRRMMGEDVEPVAEPDPSDNRFKDAEWSSNPYFDFWKQAYLLTTSWAENILQQTDGLDQHSRHKAEFYFRQITSALSPSNFPTTNPEILREIFATNGRSLVAGIESLAHDMKNSGDLLKITQTDIGAFEVGRNLATTPGKVVFQNELLQLIQYSPTTDKVREIPLLMVPPWINKFYILDLTPAKSFIKYAVDQGFTVFIISWVNPDAELASKSFEDYMVEGLLAATDAVHRETDLKQCNALGYCVGGTLLGTTLAWLAARGETPYKSVSFLTTQVDFSEAGDLLLFTTDTQLELAGKDDVRTRLPGRIAHGQRLQHDAPARPDLALRGE